MGGPRPRSGRPQIAACREAAAPAAAVRDKRGEPVISAPEAGRILKERSRQIEAWGKLREARAAVRDKHGEPVISAPYVGVAS